MKLKRTLAVLIALTILSICVLIYLTLDLSAFPQLDRESSIQQEYQEQPVFQNKWLHFEDRLKQLEKDLTRNHVVVGEIKQAIQQLKPLSSTEKKNDITENLLPASEMVYNKNCPIQLDVTPQIDIQMLEMYKDLAFDNPDGGVWKQGWKIEVDDNMWNKQHKLKVFVIPHSHNDPGWIKTFDEYYNSQTKHILNNMVEKLPEDPRRKFIWAETSYFATWWDEIENSSRDIVKRLIRNKQLEIVTGGWVMNDEANSHWVSIIHQLTEGHQWLQKNLNYTPVNHWAIDPFGMSATQAILLKAGGFKNMLIQRVHYSVKKQLASQRNLEFYWKQAWDKSDSTGIFTHMMPFYSYDVPHTCGPDPKICCQFDFKRLPNHGLSCPWRVPPQVITDTNVAEKSIILLDQYRKKSRLYKTNVLLVPLGDDFRYDHSTEWDVQYNNYQKIFDHLNGNPNLHVHAQFGTLSDYFEEISREKKKFPSLSGDFFTYADRDDHYWSGYYTSRPFYKRVERVLLYYVRAAEIILSLAHVSGKPGSRWIADKDLGLEKGMSEARKALALFQHHDGITGTAKDAVMIDYGQKMLDAILNCQNVLQLSTNLLLSGPGADNQGSTDRVFYYIDDIRQTQDSLPEQHTIIIGPDFSTKRVVIFNSLTFTRHEIVSFIVSTPYVEVIGPKGNRIQCQVSPIFEHVYSISNSKYRLSFIANVPALSLVSYVINALTKDHLPEETVPSKIKIYNLNVDLPVTPPLFKFEISDSASEFFISNARIIASFSNSGLLKALRISGKTYPVHLDFAKYGVRHTSERSGAYLFLPDGDAAALQIAETVVKVMEGPLYSSVNVQIPYVHHTVTLFNTPGADGLGLEIQNIVNIEKTSNFELVMRLSTNIDNGDEFFTDLNAYQILRRKYFKKLPLQANYYPMPSMAYIEDKNIRLSVLTGSPIGVSSLKSGQLEMMLDRRLMQDDNRGLGQGVTDNHPTRHIFRVLLEKKTQNCQMTSDNHPSGFPTLSAHVVTGTLLNPLVRLLRGNDDDFMSQKGYIPVRREFGVDFEMPIFKTGVEVQNKDYVGLVLHRKYLDMCYVDHVLLQQFQLSHGTVNISGILPSSVSDLKLNEASLTFLHIENALDVRNDISLCPMDTKAFLLHR